MASSASYTLINSPANLPASVPQGFQKDATGTVYAAVAHTQWGDIPCKAVPGNAWFPYCEKEHRTNNFSWLVVPHSSLVRQGSQPQNAIPCGNQRDKAGTLYAVIAHTPHGDIPGKGKGSTAWYCHGGKEFFTQEFSWIVSNKPASIVTLRSHHGKYVVAESNHSVNANRDQAGPWEKFEYIKHDDGTVSFKSHHNRYLVAESNGACNCNRDKIGPWEKWTELRHGDGTVSYRSAHGKFLVAEKNGKLNANRAEMGPWEKFHLNPGI